MRPPARSCRCLDSAGSSPAAEDGARGRGPEAAPRDHRAGTAAAEAPPPRYRSDPADTAPAAPPCDCLDRSRRGRAWAELLRLPALFSVPGDALAGAAAAGGTLGSRTLLAIGSSLCLYEAGMALNDWADREVDAVERPHRPLPSGRIRPAAALTAACALTGAGLALAAGAGRPALAVAAPLAATVWAYDLGLKHTPAGPVAMGAARGLDLLLGAAATTGRTRPALRSAVLLGTHTVAVTTVSRQEARGGSPLAPLAALATTALLTRLVTRRPTTTSLTGPVARRLTAASLTGSMTRRLTAALLTGPVTRRSTAALLTRPVAHRLTAAALTGPVAHRWTADPLTGPVTRRSTAASLTGPVAHRLTAALLTRPVAHRSVGAGTGRGRPQATDSRLRLTGTRSAREHPGPRAADLLAGACAAAYAATTARPYLHATLNPSPPLTQRAVGAGIRATIPLQAALTARSRGTATALLIAALAPLGAKFAKKVSVT
ncbi:SCO3242 family prenyltransferase [Streptomyces sp. bgisy032]|uniref:SCO3242 family prenyltransferase n=1 Tax=Streptomyces sp. bgisy032 TaxID=3413773 RepID=UPI003D74E88F